MTARDEMRVLAAAAAIALLAFPLRTRPLAGVLYGVFLSRAHGAGLRRLERTVTRLFDQRRSVLRRVDAIEAQLRAAAHEFDLPADPAMDSGAAG